jgi:hypothetical protein
VSPILVRPVREQLEHDRLIRLLQVKLRRKFEAAINPGNEQNAPVGIGPAAVYPDLVLLSLERSRRLQGVIEVETGESVNHLEALAQWTHLAKLRAEFHLYVPAGMVEVARRLCEDNQILVNEIWSYHSIGDQVRFTLVHRSREATPTRRPVVPAPKPAPERNAKKPARTAPPARKAPKPKARTKKPARAQKRK